MAMAFSVADKALLEQVKVATGCGSAPPTRAAA
jgi:hypothetical protein